MLSSVWFIPIWWCISIWFIPIWFIASFPEKDEIQWKSLHRVSPAALVFLSELDPLVRYGLLPSPRHVTRSSLPAIPAPAPAPSRAAHHAPARTPASTTRAPIGAESGPPQAGRASGAASAPVLLHGPSVLQRDLRAHRFLWLLNQTPAKPHCLCL